MQKGQALLLVLLSMSVVLVVALSIVSRSVTDISLTTKEEGSTRAFNAAESGVERVLVTGSGTNGAVGNANFIAGVTAVGRAVTSFSYPAALNSGESAAVWLVTRDLATNSPTYGAMVCNGSNICYSGSTIDVCWGKNATQPALEFSYYFATLANSYANVRNSRAIYDPVAGRTANATTPNSGCTIGSVTYPYYKRINLAGLGAGEMGNTNAGVGNGGYSIVAKIRMLYNTSPEEFGVKSPSADKTFPTQGNLIDSTGTAGEANRRLNVFQSIGDNPTVFDNVVYSEGDLTK